MTCKHCEDRLLPWLDRRLDAATSAEFDRHLKSSPACAREAGEMRRTWHLLGYHPGLSPTGNLPARLLEAARVQLDAERRWTWRLRKHLPLVASAAVLLVVVCFSVLWHPGASGPDAELNRILASLDPEEREVVLNLDLYENLETVQHMDVLEDQGVVEYLDLVQSFTDEDF
ncbi:MAG: zf-HC2 domain-containing protein [Candidatus Brocadiae bacterium]|nr:zf-HC2 domain-containing protein [Candidatus Brocadiia bacterium]